MSTPSDDFNSQVYNACRDGKAISLCALLFDKSEHEVRSALENLTQDEGQLTTPLLIAARNGHSKVVEILLTQYGVDIEQTGTVKFEGYTSEGASALWWAASRGHKCVVEVLLSNGADVNHPTHSNSTPLRVACFEGRLDIVSFLISNGADINISNKFNNTCLMIAAYKGHYDVVSHLLLRGARPNDRAGCEATALHFAAERGHLKIVRLLVEKGADLLENERGLTPLQLAAECSNAEIVEYLITLPNISKSAYIGALEGLGASFANDKDNYNLSKCYHYLHRAMEERYKDPLNPILKAPQVPVKAYNSHVECQTLEDLEAIKDNHHDLHMEALVVRERILGENDPEIPHPIVYRGAVFADSGRFERCISLWLRALFLRYRNSRSISKDLLRFAQVFSQMLHVGSPLEYDLVEHVFEHCLLEFEKDDIRITEAETESDSRAAMSVRDLNIRTALYLLVILIQVKETDNEAVRLCHLSYEFNRRQMRAYPLDQNLTPLHLACDEHTLVDDFHVDEVVRFPNDELVKLLISCGADVHSVDSNGNTPLHFIVQYNRPLSDFHTLHSIIMSLIEAGTHVDRSNFNRKTALDLATTGVAELILRAEQRIELKCIAARAIRKFGLVYRGQVPLMLEEFIEMH